MKSNTLKRLRILRVVRRQRHHYDPRRALGMTVTLGTLLLVPLSGLARVDLWGGHHAALFRPASFRHGLAAVILGVFIIRPTQPTTVQPEQTTMAMLESEFADFVFIDALATERSVVIELTTETTGTQDSTDEILFDIFGLEGSSL